MNNSKRSFRARPITLSVVLPVALPLLLLVACGGGGGSSSGSEAVIASGSSDKQRFEGQITKAAVQQARVSVLSLNGNGLSIGAAVDAGTTDDEGRFSVELPANTGLVRVQSTGGFYIDEADPAPADGRRSIDLGQSGGFDVIFPSDVSEFVLTLVTQLISDKSQQEANQNNLQQRLAANRQAALESIGFDLFDIVPADPTNPATNASLEEKQYGMLLGALAQALNRAATEAGMAAPDSALLEIFREDLSDGRVDGKYRGQPIEVQPGIMLTDSTNIRTEIRRFRNNNAAVYGDVPEVRFDENILAISPGVGAGDNRPPLASGEAFDVARGGRIERAAPGLLSNDSDPNGDTLTVDLVSNVSFGTLSLQSDGSFSYDHNNSQNSADSFSYAVQDGRGGSVTVAATLNITGIQDTPTIVADEVTLPSNASDIAIAVLTNDVGTINPASLEVVSGVTNGSLVAAANNQLRYTPNPGFAGEDRFTYRIANEQGDFSPVATVTITVQDAGNEPPTATSFAATVDEDSSTSLQLQGSDSDGLVQSFTIASLPANGSLFSDAVLSQPLALNDTVTVSNGSTATIYYQPNPNFNGPDSLGYRAVDDEPEASAIASVSLTVSPVNDAPMANNDSAVTDENSILQRSDANGVLANDVDIDGDTITVVNFSERSAGGGFGNGGGVGNTNGSSTINTGTPAGQELVLADGGRLTIAENGSFLFDTDDAYDSIVAPVDIVIDYSITDGVSPLPESASLTITVTPVNDVPVAVNDSYSSDEDTALDIAAGNSDLLANDSDPEGSNLTVTQAAGQPVGTAVNLPSGAQLTVNADGSFSYDPNGAFEGISANTSDSFGYVITDGEFSASAIATITISPVNDAPTASSNTLTLSEGAAKALTIAELTATDPEQNASQLVYTIQAGSLQNGTLTASSSSTLAAGDSFTQQDVADGVLEYQHNGSETNTDSLVLVLSDGIANVTVTVPVSIALVNEAPTASTNTLTVAEGSSRVLTTAELFANDPEQNASQLVFTIQPGSLQNATLFVVGTSANLAVGDTFTQQDIIDGRLQYQHDNSETNSDSLILVLSDGIETVSATVPVSITATNDAPTASSSPLTLNEGAAKTLTTAELSASDPEQTASQLVYTIQAGSLQSGTLTAGGSTLGAGDSFTQQDVVNGTLEYQHDGSETTSDSLALTLSDGIDTVPIAVPISIAPVNDAPTATTNTLTVVEGGSQALTTADLSAVDPEQNAGQLVYTIQAGGLQNGSLTAGSTALSVGDTFTQQNVIDSVLEYQHDNSETTTDSLVLTLSDGIDTVSVTVPIGIGLTNDAPTASSNTLTLDEGAAKALTTAELTASDPEQAASELVYTIQTGSLQSGAFTAAGGSLTLNVGDMFTQQDVVNGTLEYQHDGSETTADSLVLILSDGIDTVAVTVPVSIAAVNDAPNAVTNTLTVAEGGSQALTTAELSANDPEQNANQLVYTIQPGSLQNAMLIVVGTSSNLAVGDSFTQQDVVDGVLEFQHDNSETVTDSLVLMLSDGSDTVSVTVPVSITPTNDAPTASSNTLMLDEGAAKALTTAELMASDPEQNAGQLLYTIQIGSLQNGTFTVGGSTALNVGDTFTQQDVIDGTLEYQHDGSETTSDSLVLMLSDGTDTVSVTVPVSIAAVNDAPTATANTLTVAEGGSQALTAAELTASDPEQNASQLIYTVQVGGLQNGTLTAASSILNVGDSFTQQDVIDGVLEYQHDDSETTADSLVLMLSDGSDTVSVSVPVSITPENDAPTVSSNTLALDEGEAKAITTTELLATDPEQTANQLVYTIQAGSLQSGTYTVGGSAALNVGDTFTQQDVIDGTFSFQHDGSETFDGSLVLMLSDGIDTVSVSVSISVTPVNDVPTTTVNTLTVAEGESQPLTTADLSANDPEQTAEQLVYTIQAGSLQNGMLIGLGGSATFGVGDTFTQQDVIDGVLEYQHNNSETTTDSLILVLSDGIDSVSVTVPVSIGLVNDAPTASSNPLMLDEGSAKTLTTAELTASDPEQTAGELVYTIQAGSFQNGSLKPVGPTMPLQVGDTFTQQDVIDNALEYQHDGSETTTDSLILVLSDGFDTVAVTVPVSIAPVNDAPTPTANTLTVDEGSGGVITVAELTASDPEQATTELTYTIQAGGLASGGLFGAGGSIELNAGDSFTQQDINDGTLSYFHDGSETTSDAIALNLSDGTDTVAVTVPISVTPVNDAPAGVNDSETTNEDTLLTLTPITGLLSNDSDPENDSLTISEINGSLTNVGTALPLASGATVTVAADGSLMYDPRGATDALEQDEEVQDGFTYTVFDGQLSDQASVQIRLFGVNDAPVVTPSNVLVNEGDLVFIDETNLSVADPEQSGIDLVYTIQAGSLANGSLFGGGGSTELNAGDTFTQDELGGSGLLEYRHDGSETTSDSLILVLSDGFDSVNVTLSIDVTPVNDPPVFTPNPLTLDEGATALIDGNSLVANDEEQANNELVYTIQADSLANGSVFSGGSVELNEGDTFTHEDALGGLISYTHNGSETTGDSLVLSLSDGSDNVTDSLLITITPVNDAPVVDSSVLTVAEGAANPVDDTVIQVSDLDSDPADFVYTVRAPLSQNGSFGAATGGPIDLIFQPGDTFTQSQLASGAIQYTHDGSETTSDSVLLTVSDGTDSTDFTLAITITPQNDAPTVDSAELTLDEAAQQPVDETVLQISDADSNTADFVYTFDGPAPVNGSLRDAAGNMLPTGTTFTQSDVENDRIIYLHDGSETTSDSIGLSVSDGSASTSFTLAITVTPVNDPPTANLTPLAVNEGAAATVSAAELAVTDPDNGPTELVYTFFNVQRGSVFRDGSVELMNGDTFTQQDVIDGAISYVHDGSETTTDQLRSRVSDGTDNVLTFLDITITPVNDPPTLTTNDFTVDEEATGVITATNLTVDDDSANADLLYTITGTAPANGLVFVGAIPVETGGTFTQQDVVDGLVSYEHDGSETTSDALMLSLTDGEFTTSGTLNIVVNPVDDAPTLIPPPPPNPTFSTGVGAFTILTTAVLDAQDAETTDPSGLRFFIDASTLTIGQFESTAFPGITRTDFTLEEIQNGVIEFEHTENPATTTSEALSITLLDTFGSRFDFILDITVSMPSPFTLQSLSNMGGDIQEPVMAGDGNTVLYVRTERDFGSPEIFSASIILKEVSSTTQSELLFGPEFSGSVVGRVAASHRAELLVFSSNDTSVAPGVTGGEGSRQIYGYRPATAEYLLISDARDGSAGTTPVPISPDANTPFVSASGNAVVFESTSMSFEDANGLSQVYLWRAGVPADQSPVQLVSLSTMGAAASGDSRGASVSAGGRFIVFSSDASDLVESDLNGLPDIFVVDRELEITQLVSLPDGVAPDNVVAQTDRASSRPLISNDGKRVVFLSEANNLVAGDSGNTLDVFVRDLESFSTTRINVDNGAVVAASTFNNGARGIAMSGDGRYVSFVSNTDTANNTNPNGALDVWVARLPVVLSGGDFNGPIDRLHEIHNNGSSSASTVFPSLSADGAVLSVLSFSQLTADDGDAAEDVFTIENPLFIADNSIDSDGDGLSDVSENILTTSPFLADSDFDLLSDSEEVNTTNTMPLVADSDGDDVGDGTEVVAGSDPLVANSVVIHISSTNGTTGNTGDSWASPLPTNDEVGNGLVSGNSAADATWLIYEAGQYSELELNSLTNVVVQGGLSDGVVTPKGVTVEFSPQTTPTALSVSDSDNIQVSHIRMTGGMADSLGVAGGFNVAMQAGTSTSLRNSEVVGNQGAGIRFNGGTLNLNKVLVASNSDGMGIGGIDVGGTLIADDIQILANRSAFSNGGGIGVGIGQTVSINNSVIASNFAEESGGGINAGDDSTVTITNSSFVGNRAGQFSFGEGGAIFRFTSDSVGGGLTVTNSSFYINEALSNGGGIANVIFGSIGPIDPTLTDNILWFNQDSNQGSDTLNDQYRNDGANTNVTFNNIQLGGAVGSNGIDAQPPFTSELRLDQAVADPNINGGSQMANMSPVAGLSTAEDGTVDIDTVDLGVHFSQPSVIPTEAVEQNQLVTAASGLPARLDFTLNTRGRSGELIPAEPQSIIAVIVDAEGTSLTNAGVFGVVSRINALALTPAVSVGNGGFYILVDSVDRPQTNATVRLRLQTESGLMFTLNYTVTLN